MIFVLLYRQKYQKRPLNKREWLSGEAPLQTRHFDGFRYAVKMTYTAVGLTRPVEAYLLSLVVVRFCIEFVPLRIWGTNGNAIEKIKIEINP